MTEEEKTAELAAQKKADEEAKAKSEAQDAEFEASLADLSDEDKEAKRAERKAQQLDKKEVDYEAELEKERKAREEAEEKLALTRQKAKERWQAKHQEEEESEEEDKPLTKKELEEILMKDRQDTEKRFLAGRIKELAKNISSSDSEANLIIEIHKNRIFPAHLTLKEQIEEAYAIANRKKLVGERDEALRALKSRETLSKDSASTHHDALPSGEPQFSKGEKLAFTAAGFTYNITSRRWEKKLKHGTLVQDPKTKKTYLLRK